MTHHAQSRLNERVKPQHKDIAARLLDMALDRYDTALTSEVKPGLSLVVIARAFKPSTVYYCETYRVTTSHLHVSTIVTL